MDNRTLDRKSLDGQTATSSARDRQAPMIPPMPAVDHSFDTPPAVPQHTAGGALLLVCLSRP